MGSRCLPDGKSINEHWRDKLELAFARYKENRNPENRAEWLRILKLLANLIIRNEIPQSD
jgi:hypothetical protein